MIPYIVMEDLELWQQRIQSPYVKSRMKKNLIEEKKLMTSFQNMPAKRPRLLLRPHPQIITQSPYKGTTQIPLWSTGTTYTGRFLHRILSGTACMGQALVCMAVLRPQTCMSPGGPVNMMFLPLGVWCPRVLGDMPQNLFMNNPKGLKSTLPHPKAPQTCTFNRIMGQEVTWEIQIEVWPGSKKLYQCTEPPLQNSKETEITLWKPQPQLLPMLTKVVWAWVQLLIGGTQLMA